MGGHQKSVKTKSFLGQLCDEKNSVPYPSGNFRGCGAEFFCDRETGDSAGFCYGKKIVNPILGNKKCPEPESNQRHEDFQSSALPTELSGHFDFLLETFVNITWIRENCNCFIENLEKIVLLEEWRCIFVRECGSIKDMQRGTKEKY